MVEITCYKAQFIIKLKDARFGSEGPLFEDLVQSLHLK